MLFLLVNIETTNGIEAIANGTISGTDVPVLVQKLFQAVQPTTTPTSIPRATSLAAKAWGVSSPQQSPVVTSDNFLANVLTLVLDGFTTSDVTAVAQGLVSRQYIDFLF